METINNDTEKEAEQEPTVSADSKDYYAILGIPKTATEKQISNSYKKLALKYHPDRNQDNEEAAKMFAAVSEAYHVLIDPNKRRQYDLGGEKAAPTDFESVDVTSLGGIGRVFGAMISRLGVPIPTQIAPDILEAAQNICRNGGLEGGGPPIDPRVQDLAWGWPHDNKVDRQSAAYYRISVDARQVENGFFILCRSPSKGKFKLILFDTSGSVLFQEESIKTRDKHGIPQAALYFTNFDAFRLGEPTLTAYEKDMPTMFAKLDGFSSAKKHIPAGQYLLCVYGDNFLGKTAFNIIAVQSKNDALEVTLLEDTDEALLESKKNLETLKNEYTAAKAAYEGVIARMKEESDKVDALIQTREGAYSGFFNASIREFSPSTGNDEPVHHSSSGAAAAPAASASSAEKAAEEDHGAASSTAAPSAGAGAAAGVAHAAQAAQAALGTAASTATAAGGWFARRLSLGIQAIVKPSAAPAAAPNTARSSETESETGAVLEGERHSFDSSLAGPTSVGSVEGAPHASTASVISDGPAEEASAPSPVQETAAAHEEEQQQAAEKPAEDEPSAATASAAPAVTRPTIKSKKDKKAAAAAAAASHEETEGAAAEN